MTSVWREKCCTNAQRSRVCQASNKKQCVHRKRESWYQTLGAFLVRRGHVVLGCGLAAGFNRLRFKIMGSETGSADGVPFVSSIEKGSISRREIVPVATNRLASNDFNYSSHSTSHARARSLTSSWNVGTVTIEAFYSLNFFRSRYIFSQNLSNHREQLIEPSRNPLQTFPPTPLIRKLL